MVLISPQNKQLLSPPTLQVIYNIYPTGLLTVQALILYTLLGGPFDLVSLLSIPQKSYYNPP